MRVLDKHGLYEITKWFSKDCEKIVADLEKVGLVIVRKEDVERYNRMEDDLK